MADTSAALARLLRPQSVAIVGASPKPLSLGGNILANFKAFGYDGALHLVSRSQTEIDGIACVPSIDDLPEGIDLVALIVPSEAIADSLRACARRKVRGAIVFSAGFAETGEAGRAMQEEIVGIAEAANMALLGPNCLGFANFLLGVPATFEPLPVSERPAKGAAIVTQSGAMAGNLRIGLLARHVPVAMSVSTGNEAVTSSEEILDVLVDDPAVTQLVVCVEQIKKPRLFLDAARRAMALGKPLLLMHPGKSARSMEAALTHTGAVAGDHAVMECFAREHGVILAEGFDEMFDLAAIVARYPQAQVSGVGIMSNSGAVRGFTLDFCHALGLDLPRLAPETIQTLAAVLPDFATLDNPLDITAQGMKQPSLFGDTTAALLDDPSIDAVVVAVVGGSPAQIMNKWNTLRPVMSKSEKPVVYIVVGDEHPMPDAFLEDIAASGVPFMRSPERALRAFRRLADRRSTTPAPLAVHPIGEADVVALSECTGKALLVANGLDVPAGRLVNSAQAAAEAAETLGYPVVAKAQSGALPHKSDAGGVALNLGSPQSVSQAYGRIIASVYGHAPEVALEGVLIERQSEPAGAELIVAARRDPLWGGVLVVGMGGIWAEVMGDMRMMPAGVDVARIEEEIRALKGAALLTGARGIPALDIAAAAGVVSKLGHILAEDDRIAGIEINPLALYPEGVGILDVLMTVRAAPAEKLETTA